MVYSESLKRGLCKYIWVLGVSSPPKKIVDGKHRAGQEFVTLGQSHLETVDFCLYYDASVPGTQQVGDKSVTSNEKAVADLGGGI